MALQRRRLSGHARCLCFPFRFLLGSHFVALPKEMSFLLPQQDSCDKVRVALEGGCSARRRLCAGIGQSLCKSRTEKRKLVTPGGEQCGLLSLRNTHTQIYLMSCPVLTLTAHLSSCYCEILWLRVSCSLSACWVSFIHLLTFGLLKDSTNTKAKASSVSVF